MKKSRRLSSVNNVRLKRNSKSGYANVGWVDRFAFVVVRMLIGFARIRSVYESVRIANPSRRRGSQ